MVTSKSAAAAAAAATTTTTTTTTIISEGADPLRPAWGHPTAGRS